MKLVDDKSEQAHGDCAVRLDGDPRRTNTVSTGVGSRTDRTSLSTGVNQYLGHPLASRA